MTPDSGTQTRQSQPFTDTGQSIFFTDTDKPLYVITKDRLAIYEKHTVKSSLKNRFPTLLSSMVHHRPSFY